MKKTRMGLSAVAVVGTAALVLTGCASGSGDDNSSSGDASAIIKTNGTEPENPLVPSNTTETGGGRIVTSIFAGLVSYNADGTTKNEVAESIESDDATVWTVTLKDGWKFTDGTDVTSESFTKAWNWAASFDNVANSSGSSFFENFKGYSDTAQSDLDLTVESPTEFTVTLNTPEADFPLRLGYSAYSPLPESFYADPAAFGENPVGNGPYMLDGEGAWTHNQGIKLKTNPDYDGNRKPKNGGLDINFYTSLDSAYADVQGGNLDVLDQIGPAAFQTYQSDFPDTNVNQPAAVFQGMTIPQYLAHFGDDEEGNLRRQAISMSINRDDVTKVIFQGTRTPAKDFTSPVIPGYTDELEGESVLSFDADKAKDLWDQADAISPYGDTTFTIGYNSDGGHQEWVDAVTANISKTLGIKAEGKPYPTFAEFRTDASGGAMTGAFRSGWQADYPSLYNFLYPTMATSGSSNDGKYSNPEFDDLLAEGSAASDVDDANASYQKAQEVLLKDLPIIPLWYANVNGVWADTVSNVEYGWDSVPIYENITK
ncbi:MULTISPECIES: peptide ABC transporter substrate-binding protein [unclassified Frigoribacterium]|uniref:peptide ABC transporter substrate-binding protein n=1 Tax=unclassified Frigoribacterium TaxID=2627005 RepID=UPI0005BC6E37|nr:MULTISPECIES: ABC transporter substrate-binding protein [unclassified Frigoribacterium]KIU02817.1 ABC transporter substrate-binding protein [Frigoribacterium sp. MEB024]MBD8538417.1 ABC transporter substrate-binding protein [Frigoribacterium sp. CFBP 8751]